MVQFGSHPGLPGPKPRPALFGAGEEPSPTKQQEVKKEEKLSFAQAILNSPTNKPQIDFKLHHPGVGRPLDKKSGEATAEGTAELPSYAELVAKLNKPGHTPEKWSTKFPNGLQKIFEDTIKHAHHFVAASIAASEEAKDADKTEEAEEKAKAPAKSEDKDDSVPSTTA